MKDCFWNQIRNENMLTTTPPMTASSTSFLRRGALAVAVLLALAQLTGCVQPGLAAVPPGLPPAAPVSEVEALPAATASTPAAAASDAQSAEDDDTPRQPPQIIRGNDRLVAPQPSASARAPRGDVAGFKFDNAPVGEVVQVMLRDLLKVDYVVHPPLQGTVTLVTRQPVSVDRALLLLETALQANGIVMARDSRGVYHVGTPDVLHGIIAAPAIAEPGQPLPPGYGAVIIPLRYLGANEMATILKPIVAPDAILRVDSVRNLLVMRGTRAEAEGWLDLVATFDVNLLRGMSVGVFPLKYTSSDDVVAQLRLLSGATGGETPGAPPVPPGAVGRGGARLPPQAPMRPGLPQAAQQQAQTAMLGENNPLFGAIRVMPIDRINAVMVVTPRAAYLDEIRYWIEQFDRPNMNSNEPQLYVYKVKNGSADHLAELLNGIYGGGVLSQQISNTGGNTGVAPGMGAVAGVNSGFNNNNNNRFGNNSFGNNGFGNNGFGNNSFGGGFGSGGIGGGFNGGGIGGGGFNGGGFNSGGFNNGGMNNNNQGPGVMTTMLGTTVRVMADRINNTLLIHATPAEYARIESSLKRLDVQRAQVLIEASIVEVTLGDNLQYGLEWAFKNHIASRDDGNNTYRGTGTLGNPSLNGGGSNVFSGNGRPSNGFTWALTNTAGTIGATLSALADQSLMKVISSPSLLVLDNQTASIQVGNQEPISTGSVTPLTNTDSTVYTSSTIQYVSTGVMLGVTPSVTAGDLVTMDINQVVSQANQTSATIAGQQYPTFLQRQINTQVAVRSGETIVLGGLIQDTSQKDKSGIPLLSRIPVLGALFGTHTSNSGRTELLVIITPRVVRSDEDARAVSREMRDRMRGLTADEMPAAVPAPGTP